MKGYYAGSFDPLTRGHIALIRKAMEICDELTVVVAINPGKSAGVIPSDERKDLIRRVMLAEGLGFVSVVVLAGTVGEYARVSGGKLSKKIFIRGIRGPTDLEAEMKLLRLNEQYFPEIQTVFLASDASLEHVSSSVVKQLWLDRKVLRTEPWWLYVHDLIRPVFDREMGRFYGC